MDYDDGSVSEIATHYTLLRESLEKLRDARKDKHGAVLGYVSKHYEIADRAVKFLQAVPDSLKERLKLEELEIEFDEFANTVLRL